MTGQDLNAALQGLTVPFVIFDLDLKVLKINTSAMRIIKKGDLDSIEKSLASVKSDSLYPEIAVALHQTANDGIKREFILNDENYDYIFSNVISRVGNSLLLEINNLTEIYQAKLQEKIAHRAKEGIKNATGNPILEIDLINQTFSANDVAVEFFGDLAIIESTMFSPFFDMATYEPEKDVNFQFPGAELYQNIFNTLKRVWLTGETAVDMIERPTLKGDGVFLRRVMRWDYEGEPRSLYIIGQDLTEVMSLKEELESSQLKLEGITKSLNIWTVTFDEAKGSAEIINPSGGIYVEEDFLASIGPVKSALLKDAIATLYQEKIHSIYLPDSSGTPSQKATLSFLNYREPGKSSILIVIRDVTHEFDGARESQQEGQNLQTQQFAQGIAHDFGNIAQSFDGYIQLLRGEISSADGASMLDALSNAAYRAVRISRQVGEIARYQFIENHELNVDTLIRGNIDFLETLVSDGINLEILPCECSYPNTYANADQLLRIIENIIENANRALNNSGDITIKCDQDIATNEIIIQISNNGPAIPATIAERIFEPFTSTRKQDGSGLGLYLASEYLLSCDGSIELSNHNRNVTFTIRLPQLAKVLYL